MSIKSTSSGTVLLSIEEEGKLLKEEYPQYIMPEVGFIEPKLDDAWLYLEESLPTLDFFYWEKGFSKISESIVKTLATNDKKSLEKIRYFLKKKKGLLSRDLQKYDPDKEIKNQKDFEEQVSKRMLIYSLSGFESIVDNLIEKKFERAKIEYELNEIVKNLKEQEIRSKDIPKIINDISTLVSKHFYSAYQNKDYKSLINLSSKIDNLVGKIEEKEDFHYEILSDQLDGLSRAITYLSGEISKHSQPLEK